MILVNLNYSHPCFEIMSENMEYSNQIIYDNKIENSNTKDTNTDTDTDFIFYQGIDHLNDDIYGLNIHTYSISKLKELCKQDKNCIGFNTLGFFKNKIDVLNLRETDWINKNTTHGIFVKTNVKNI